MYEVEVLSSVVFLHHRRRTRFKFCVKCLLGTCIKVPAIGRNEHAWLKAVLHYAIFRATCVAKAKSALLQLHEQIVLHPAMFLATCPSGDEVKVEDVFLLADRTKHCETSCKRCSLCHSLCRIWKNTDYAPAPLIVFSDVATIRNLNSSL